MQTATVTRDNGTTVTINNVTSYTVVDNVLTITYTTEAGNTATVIFAAGKWAEVVVV